MDLQKGTILSNFYIFSLLVFNFNFNTFMKQLKSVVRAARMALAISTLAFMTIFFDLLEISSINKLKTKSVNGFVENLE